MAHFGSNRKRSSGWTNLAVPGLFFAAVLGIFVQAVSGVAGGTGEQQLEIARDAVRRAAVQCYALEGQYPPSITYLEQRYGLSVDREKYVVHYRYTGGNLMPEIAVFSIEGES